MVFSYNLMFFRPAELYAFLYLCNYKYEINYTFLSYPLFLFFFVASLYSINKCSAFRSVTIKRYSD